MAGIPSRVRRAYRRQADPNAVNRDKVNPAAHSGGSFPHSSRGLMNQ